MIKCLKCEVEFETVEEAIGHNTKHLQFFRPEISLKARVLAFGRWRKDFGVQLDPERLTNIWDAYLIAAELDIREQEGV